MVRCHFYADIPLRFQIVSVAGNAVFAPKARRSRDAHGAGPFLEEPLHAEDREGEPLVRYTRELAAIRPSWWYRQICSRFPTLFAGPRLRPNPELIPVDARARLIARRIFVHWRSAVARDFAASTERPGVAPDAGRPAGSILA